MKSHAESLHDTADTASQALKAAEGLAGDLTNATKNLLVGVIRGFQEVSAAIGVAILESARGTVQGVGLVGADVGAVAKGTAIGLIHGSAEVGAEFGKVWKIRGLQAIKGATETMATVVHDVGKLGYARGPSSQPEKAAPPDETPPSAATNILSIAPVVVATVETNPASSTP